MFKLTSRTACPTHSGKKRLRDYTRRESGHHAQPKAWCHSGGSLPAGTGPIPRTSQKEQLLAMQGCPWDSRKLNLKQILARLSILILSKAYPGLGIF
jgi:hypothetical protein